MKEKHSFAHAVQSLDIGLENEKIAHSFRSKFAINNTILILFFGYVGYYLCRNNISASFPLLAQEFGYSNAQLGLIAAYSELLYSLAKFINGPLADKFGGKKLFILGMAGAIACNFLFALGSHLWYFIGIWCVCRIFLSMGWAGMANIVARTIHTSVLGKTMGFLSLSFMVGAIVATLFAGFLVKIGTPWQGIFIYPAIVLVFIMLICQKTLPNFNKAYSSDRLAASPSTINALKELLKRKAFAYLMIYSFFVTFLRSILTIWLPKIFYDLGASASSAIVDSTLFLVFGSISTIFVGICVDKTNSQGRGKIMVSMLFMLVLSLSCIYWQLVQEQINFPLLVAGMALSGFFLLGPYSMAAGVLSLDIGKDELSGSCTGFVDGIGYFGGAIALWLAGFLSDYWGWDDVVLLLIVTAIGATFSAYILGKHLQSAPKKA